MRPKTSPSIRPARTAALLAALTVPILLATPAAAAGSADWTDTGPPVLDQDYWFEAVDPLSNDDAWAAGVAYGPELDDGVLMHWDGRQWTHDLLPGVPLADVSALSATSAWAVGYDSTAGQAVAVHGGPEWTTTPILPPDPDSTRSNVNGVAALAADDVWVAGTVNAAESDTAFISHWNGKAWTAAEVPLPDGATASFLNSMTATADGQIWAAGTVRLSDGTSRAWLPRFDGETWSDTPVPAASATTVGVFDVAADGDGAWAAGMRAGTEHPSPLLLRWEAGQWTEVPTGIADGLAEGVSPDGAGGAVVVGYDSTFDPMLLRYRDGEVTAEASPVTGDVVRLMDAALTSDGGDLWVTGDHKTPEFVKGIGVHTAG